MTPGTSFFLFNIFYYLLKIILTTQFTDFIKSWTITDVKKRKLAYKNNLKYLEIFSSDFNTCKNIILKFINKNTSN